MSARPLHSQRQQATKDTCDEYRRMAAAGGDPSEIVTGLACFYSVNRPAIWRRLRAGGVLPPYRQNTGIIRYARRSSLQISAEIADRPRVDRDPCPRCGVRGDVGCKHSRAPVGMTFQ